MVIAMDDADIREWLEFIRDVEAAEERGDERNADRFRFYLEGIEQEMFVAKPWRIRQVWRRRLTAWNERQQARYLRGKDAGRAV